MRKEAAVEAGLWIDHRQATIVRILEQGEAIILLDSKIEKRVRYSGASKVETTNGHQDTAEDKRDRRYTEMLNRYYDEVIASLGEADSILIFGPGEAKGELQHGLEEQKVPHRTIAVETTDKLTEAQIIAKVRQHFGHARVRNLP